MPRLWPREAVDYLRDNWRDGWSFSELAVRVNGQFGFYFTRSAIAGKVQRMALKNTNRVRVVPLPPRKPRKVIPLTLAAKPVKPVCPPDLHLPPTIWKELLELRDADCHFPYGHTVPFPFCGLPAIPGLPWCPFHARLCYNHPIREDVR